MVEGDNIALTLIVTINRRVGLSLTLIETVDRRDGLPLSRGERVWGRILFCGDGKLGCISVFIQ